VRRHCEEWSHDHALRCADRYLNLLTGRQTAIQGSQQCKNPHCARDLDDEDDLLFGVHEEMLYARNSPPVPGAQWTGIVTQVAIDMLESGVVDAVVCVQSQDGDRFAPKPVHTLALCCSAACQHKDVSCN
jgi:coenzyme F420-reducing hydrogenase beta subunit